MKSAVVANKSIRFFNIDPYTSCIGISVNSGIQHGLRNTEFYRIHQNKKYGWIKNAYRLLKITLTAASGFEHQGEGLVRCSRIMRLCHGAIVQQISRRPEVFKTAV